MSDNRLGNTFQIIEQTKHQFDQIAKIHNVVNFVEECSYAKMILSGNEYLARVAAGNPDSLKRAIIGVASVGLSLNPFKSLAYLVPRKNTICLDIGYRGFIQQALDLGAIKWAAVELVYENDTYKHLGMNKSPIHEFEPFKDRGRLLGGYCVSRLATGDDLIAHMAIDDIFALRDRTESWKAYKARGASSPWNTDTNEMIKKTIIKRARKSWPLAQDDRVIKADALEGDADPIFLEPSPEPNDSKREDLYLKIRTGLEIIDRSEAKFCSYLKNFMGRDVKKMEDLTTLELEKAFVLINAMVDDKTKREQK